MRGGDLQAQLQSLLRLSSHVIGCLGCLAVYKDTDEKIQCLLLFWRHQLVLVARRLVVINFIHLINLIFKFSEFIQNLIAVLTW